MLTDNDIIFTHIYLLTCILTTDTYSPTENKLNFCVCHSTHICSLNHWSVFSFEKKSESIKVKFTLYIFGFMMVSPSYAVNQLSTVQVSVLVDGGHISVQHSLHKAGSGQWSLIGRRSH